ncbi:glycoside hydrolase family 3 C-terminal domain-containing protein [Geofilum sp. OHC36d9]|uniref:glycoside hydrolase family 3 C-terminal domain-containing protein n=1 Tax=Geofilum sp. OHC36d9 TaxID=3458413 RepID=UPI0040348E9C
MKRSFFTGLICSLIVFCVSAQERSVPTYLDDSKPLEQRVEDALSRMTLEEKVAMVHAQSKFSSAGCSRLGIPEIWMSDGPNGIRPELMWDSFKAVGWTNDSCTAFPALTCLAATFDPQLAMEYGIAIGAEARYRKKDILLGPGVNIYRTPLNGRNFEYMGEDPYLASQMVVPYIQGVQQNGVAACLKHFALNNQERWRHNINVEVSDRALYEIYLPAFKAGVQEGDVWAVMGAYNLFRGQHCCHHDLLLNQILRNEWGFEGVVVSDWGGVYDTDESARNGLDIEMGTWSDGLSYGRAFAYDDYFLARPFLKKIESGELPLQLLDDKVRRVLRLVFRTNMDRNRPWGSFATEAHADISRRIAEQGIVLLKNETPLFPVPVGKYNRILVVGENATKSLTVGGGSSELKVKKEVSPLEGLIDKYGEETIYYTSGYTSEPQKYNADSLMQEALNLAKSADVVIYIGGLNKNPFQDSEAHDRKAFDLPYGQNDLIESLLGVNKNTGVVIISGNGIAMPWIDQVPAIIQSWYLGSQAGNALANVISGEVNPSGKLPFSIPKKLNDNGANSFGPSVYPGDSINVYYKEDILVGYRWFDTKKIEPQFPFGFGLSYTTFNYGKLITENKEYSKSDVIRLSCSISNNGQNDGAETLQIYSSQQHPSLPRPLKELKAFQKVFLKVGETKTVSFSIPVEDLAFFDDEKHEWVVEPDRFTLSVATSSADIRSSVRIKVIE